MEDEMINDEGATLSDDALDALGDDEVADEEEIEGLEDGVVDPDAEEESPLDEFPNTLKDEIGDTDL